jgi:DNA-binding Xre family transcriptional regulator
MSYISMVRLKIKEIAQAQDINMSKLSRKSDVSYATIQALFHNPRHDVSLYILERIAKALDVSICDLLDEQEER